MAGGKAREIKNRIKGVKSTHQITKAMEIVSTTKFKKFSTLVKESRPFSSNIDSVLKSIANSVKHEKHVLFGKKEEKEVAVIIFSSDRGLCGSFNNNIFKASENIKNKLIEEGKKVSLITIGRKARDYCRKRNYDVKGEYIQLIPEFMYDKAMEISENIVEFFYEDIFDEVYVVYTEFLTALNSKVITNKLLPIERIENSAERTEPYIFEPSPEGVLSSLLPKYLNIYLYQCLLESTASEHAARKAAMKSATENAEEMINDLTLQYNRERQAAITQEISEIVGGASAIE